MDNTVESCMRVFLSADLVGSTILKNQLNHHVLLEKYRSRIQIIERLQKEECVSPIPDDKQQAVVLESLGISEEDVDWATVVCNFYMTIHSAFVAALDRRKFETISKRDEIGTVKPWKAVGDELIYALPCPGRRDLHEIVVAFLSAVRESDSKVSPASGGAVVPLRVKGSAWVAGFPVRNREIALPPDGRKDYLGPDIDTGFRIGKCTRPGMLAVSVELAELLGECQAQYAPMLGKIVGWEVLKGVWNNQRYPIVWVDFPDSHPAAFKFPASVFSLWDQEDCPWCKNWEDVRSPKLQLSNLATTLRELRENLPKSLGIVNPYIVADPLEDGNTPDDHREIVELLKAIQFHAKDNLRQDTSSGETDESGQDVGRDLATVRDSIRPTKNDGGGNSGG